MGGDGGGGNGQLWVVWCYILLYFLFKLKRGREAVDSSTASIYFFTSHHAPHPITYLSLFLSLFLSRARSLSLIFFSKPVHVFGLFLHF